ncbi:hypothetical protein CDO47_24200, partial [Pseudomonas aeruginosa]
TWHTNYDFFPDCANPRTENVPTNGVMNAMPDPSLVLPPNRRICARNDNAISDARYEAYRSAIVAQTRALLVGVGNALAQGAQAD